MVVGGRGICISEKKNGSIKKICERWTVKKHFFSDRDSEVLLTIGDFIMKS